MDGRRVSNLIYLGSNPTTSSTQLQESRPVQHESVIHRTPPRTSRPRRLELLTPLPSQEESNKQEENGNKKVSTGMNSIPGFQRFHNNLNPGQVHEVIGRQQCQRGTLQRTGRWPVFQVMQRPRFGNASYQNAGPPRRSPYQSVDRTRTRVPRLSNRMPCKSLPTYNSKSTQHDKVEKPFSLLSEKDYNRQQERKEEEKHEETEVAAKTSSQNVSGSDKNERDKGTQPSGQLSGKSEPNRVSSEDPFSEVFLKKIREAAQNVHAKLLRESTVESTCITDTTTNLKTDTEMKVVQQTPKCCKNTNIQSDQTQGDAAEHNKVMSVNENENENECLWKTPPRKRPLPDAEENGKPAKQIKLSDEVKMNTNICSVIASISSTKDQLNTSISATVNNPINAKSGSTALKLTTDIGVTTNVMPNVDICSQAVSGKSSSGLHVHDLQGSSQVSASKVSSGVQGSPKVSTGKVSSGVQGSLQVSTGKVSSVQGSPQVSTGKVSSGVQGSTQVSTGKVPSGIKGSSQVSSGKVVSGVWSKVSTRKVSSGVQGSSRVSTIKVSSVVQGSSKVPTGKNVSVMSGVQGSSEVTTSKVLPGMSGVQGSYKVSTSKVLSGMSGVQGSSKVPISKVSSGSCNMCKVSTSKVSTAVQQSSKVSTDKAKKPVASDLAVPSKFRKVATLPNADSISHPIGQGRYSNTTIPRGMVSHPLLGNYAGDLSHLPRIPKKSKPALPSSLNMLKPEEDAVESSTQAQQDHPETSCSNLQSMEIESKEPEPVQKKEEESKMPPLRDEDEDEDIFEDNLGVSDVLDEDDSEDDDLMEVPVALQQIREASTRPIPLKTTKNITIEDDLPSRPETISVGAAHKKYKYNLDKLLSDKKQKEKEEDKIRSLEHLIQDDIPEDLAHIADADFDSVMNSQDILPEHREMLLKFQSSEQVILDFPPGENIFETEKLGEMFDFPNTLKLSQFGFQQGTSLIDQNLCSLEESDPEYLLDFLTGDVVLLCFDALTTPEAFLSWLFHLVSVVPYSLIANSGHKILYHVLKGGTSKAKEWVPNLKEITRVLLNYGSELESLLPCVQEPPFVPDSLRLVASGTAAADAQNVGDNLLRSENLQIIIQTLSAAFQYRKEQYSREELELIYIMLCKVALDVNLTQGPFQHELKICLANIIDAIPEEAWHEQVCRLCEILPGVTSHHHNKVQLVQLVPYTHRGVELRSRLAYANLLHLLQLPFSATKINSFKLSYLVDILHTMNVKEGCDYYLLTSMLSMADLTVGNENLPAHEKMTLRELCDTLRPMISEVRDSIHDLDRTRVKDKMTRIYNRWQLLMQRMGLRQLSIFNWAQQEAGEETIQVETVQLEHDEDDTEDDGDTHQIEKTSIDVETEVTVHRPSHTDSDDAIQENAS